MRKKLGTHFSTYNGQSTECEGAGSFVPAVKSPVESMAGALTRDCSAPKKAMTKQLAPRQVEWPQSSCVRSGEVSPTQAPAASSF